MEGKKRGLTLRQTSRGRAHLIPLFRERLYGIYPKKIGKKKREIRREPPKEKSGLKKGSASFSWLHLQLRVTAAYRQKKKPVGRSVQKISIR